MRACGLEKYHTDILSSVTAMIFFKIYTAVLETLKDYFNDSSYACSMQTYRTGLHICINDFIHVFKGNYLEYSDDGNSSGTLEL